MKKIIILLSIMVLSLNLNAQTSISLEQVAEEVKQSNFTVLKNAQRVYQAKETINFNTTEINF